jgi:hypothetical protein
MKASGCDLCKANSGWQCPIGEISFLARPVR